MLPALKRKAESIIDTTTPTGRKSLVEIARRYLDEIGADVTGEPVVLAKRIVATEGEVKEFDPFALNNIVQRVIKSKHRGKR